LILQEESFLKGILTEKDIIWALTKKSRMDLSKVRAGDICAKKLTTIKPSADVTDAIKLMRKKKFRRLPVTINKKVIGYLTLKDILRIQPELFEIAQESYVIREQAEKLKRKESGESAREGICEECGNYNILENQDGRLVCDDCREDV
jgi:signal-transduction protein with cAMP-binding, CBS, and nucleotidyltransferase domain